MPEAPKPAEEAIPKASKYFTEEELTNLRRLENALRSARPHSKEAVSIGHEMARIYGQAAARQKRQPMPAWMKEVYNGVITA